MVNRLDIKHEMRAVDVKDRGFYDDLTEEEQRRLSLVPLIRWVSDVQGSRELEEYYVIATNERLNRHFFSINTTRHKKLQWLMATSVSPGMGTHRHQWIAPKKKDTGSNEIKKALLELYPTMKASDIDDLSTLIDKKELKQHLREHGNTDKD